MKTKSAQTLENIYHRGQEKIWDGREVLAELLEKHDGIGEMEPRQARALQNIFAVILAGEEAAWKISLQLADKLDNIEARLAATSQAHDESRHFYVMRDYLELTDYQPRQVPEAVSRALGMVMSTQSLPKKLLGMQLMVEPVALTIFQEIRRVSPEPAVVEDMGPAQIISLISWQLRIFMLELQGLRELREDFEALGLNIEDVFELAEKKQINALQDFVGGLGLSRKVWEPIRYFIRYQKGRMLR